jgi:lysophospholipase L1-like esterase
MSSHHQRQSLQHSQHQRQSLSQAQHQRKVLSLSQHGQVSIQNGRATFSCFLIGLTLLVIAFQTTESSTYLKAIQSNTQVLADQLGGWPFEVHGREDQTASQQLSNGTTGVPSPPPFVTVTQLSSFQNDHPMCQRLGASMTDGAQQTAVANILNAGNLWHRHLNAILEASYYPRDANGTHLMDPNTQNVFRNLLFDLTPHELEQGLLTYPKAADVERIWNVLEARRQQPNKAPPLRVLVMGGSVVEGVGCEQPTDGKDKDAVATGRDCSWPGRLEKFVNAFLGFDAIRVVNIAQGGTGTDQATSQIKYWMYQSQMEGHVPDVIIHAFGSNDSHLGEKKASERERISDLHEQATRRLNLFVQTLQRSHPCPPPILVHLDDYFGGHRQGALLGDFTYRMVLKEIAGWYGNFAVSSAQVVDELIYPDTLGEKAFSPEWRIKQRGDNAGQFNENVHFGFGGHLAVLWTWVYSVTKTAVQFCNNRDWEQHRNAVSREMFQEPALRRSAITGNVHQLRGFLPPPLNYELDLQQVSQSMLNEKFLQLEHCKTVSTNPPCVMAFVAGPEGQTSTKALLARYLSPWFTSRNNWKFEADMSHGWSRKLGLVAVAPYAAMTFTFQNISKPVQVLTVHSLKSYGAAWEASAAEFSIRKKLPASGNTTAAAHIGWIPVHTEIVAGVHNSTSSITYSTEMTFPPVEVGSDMELDIKLVGGSKFKITGMMLCSR